MNEPSDLMLREAHNGTDWRWDDFAGAVSDGVQHTETSDLRVFHPESPSALTDLFGVPETGLVRKPPALTQLLFLLELSAPDCALGPIRARYLVSGDGQIRSHVWDPSLASVEVINPNGEPMVLEAPHSRLLLWLHGPAIFGNLMWSGAGVEGDLIDYAALDGIVSAPAVVGPEALVVNDLIAVSAR